MISIHETQAEPKPCGTNTKRGIEKMVLRLVKSEPARRAIKEGQVDAIVDPANGAVFLLPEAQKSFIESSSVLHRLYELACDWSWEQDDQYRFISRTVVNFENFCYPNEDIIGLTLWDLAMDNISEADRAKYRQQQTRHLTFRNLEVMSVDRSGTVKYLSFSGEPIFDDTELFTGYRGIARDITVHRQEQSVSQESDQYSSFMLNSLTDHVAVLDPTGVVMRANIGWKASASTCTGIGAGVTEGDNYLEVCDNVDEHERIDANLIAAGIRQVLCGARDFFAYEYVSDSSAEKRWFVLDITKIAIGGSLHAVVLRKEITIRKRREILQELQHAIALCLAGAEDVTETLKTVIRTLCKSQRWSCGRYFQSDPALGALCFVEAWGEPVAAIDLFIEKSRELYFYPGTGLPGRVFQSGQPLWVCDGSRNIEMSASALTPENGKEGAFIFPVTSNDHTIGVLAFTSATVCEPDNTMLQTIKSIGNQLGRYLQRQQVLDALRRSEARFRKLTEISSDWFWEQNSDLQFTQNVGCGPSDTAEVLGRTFWELPNIVLTDAAMREQKSRMHARWSFFDFEFAAVQPDGTLSYYSICGEPVYDDIGIFSGYCGTGRSIADSRSAV